MKYHTCQIASTFRRGFTLIELLMVIAIIAIISTLAVNKVGSVRERAALKISIANQKQIERAVEAYLTDGGMLNRLDGLTYASVRNSSSADGATTGLNFNETFTANGLAGWPYRGPADSGSESIRETTNAGLMSSLVAATPVMSGGDGESLLVRYGLSAWEATCLRERLGLKYVMRHYPKATGYPSANGFEYGDDGTVPNATDGLDPNGSACIANAVTNGLCVLAVNPKSHLGRTVYQALGQELLSTKKWTESYTESEVRDEIAAKGGALLVFGLGDEASIIGKANAGLESAPYSTYTLKKHYSRYLLLFRVPTPSGSVRMPRVEFAGVLDCCGNTIRAAEYVLKNM